MSVTALLLILVAALLHATWNLISKVAGGGRIFAFLVGIINLAMYLPVVAVFVWWRHPVLTGGAIAWIAGSGVLKTGYSLFLLKSYRSGDFSLVYPLARGTGPLLATLAAILFLGERPSPLGLVGGLMILSSIFLLTGGLDPWRSQGAHARAALKWGLGSGLFIASYTLWDRRGVAVLGIPPVLYDAGTTLTTVLLLAPFAAGRRDEVAEAWRRHRWHAAGVAAFSSLAYILVLTALVFTPVSYVAPAREISIVFGAWIGARYFKEAHGRRRIWSAAAIAAGIVALALG